MGNSADGQMFSEHGGGDGEHAKGARGMGYVIELVLSLKHEVCAN